MTRPRPTARPRLEALETRQLLATFTVTSTDDAGAGSLRDAITRANATVEPDTIAFAIPGAGPHVIRPRSILPEVTGTLAIDGYTQPGARPNRLEVGTDAQLEVVLDGTALPERVEPDDPPATLLILGGSGSLVRGLAFRGGESGVILLGAGNAVEGCFFGTTADGSSAAAKLTFGVAVSRATDARVGGTTPEARNLVSNNGQGIVVGGGARRTRIQGNLVGTDATGTRALPNANGIQLLFDVEDTLVGGTEPGAGNTISGNTYDALFAFFGTARTTVQGNLIGVDATGTRPLGNGASGVTIQGGPGPNLIGGTEPGAGNVIANSAFFGVNMNGRGSQVALGNSLYASGLEGLKVERAGPAGLEILAPPVLVAADWRVGGPTVRGRLDTLPGEAYRIEFFASPARATSGRGEGQTFLGALTLPAGAGGPVAFAFDAPVVPTGQLLTATATSTRVADGVGLTSTFSNAVVAPDTQSPVVVSAVRVGFHMRPTRLVLTADEPLDRASATDLAHYRLVGTGPDGRLGTRDDRVLKIKTVTLDPAGTTITVGPRLRLPRTLRFRLTVSGVTDPAGNPLQGPGGGPYIADFGPPARRPR
jgi:hypothetical protein